MSELNDDAIYDHLPDGTILGPMPFGDAKKMADLLSQRMTPEAFADMIAHLTVGAGR